MGYIYGARRSVENEFLLLLHLLLLFLLKLLVLLLLPPPPDLPSTLHSAAKPAPPAGRPRVERGSRFEDFSRPGGGGGKAEQGGRRRGKVGGGGGDRGPDHHIINVIYSLLETLAPEFAWRWDKLIASDYGLPQTRQRIFIRGLRKTILGQVPAPMPAFETPKLSSLLGNFPNVSRDAMTRPGRRVRRRRDLLLLLRLLPPLPPSSSPTFVASHQRRRQRKNLSNQEKRIREHFAQSKLVLEDVVCFAVDRDIEAGSFNAGLGVNLCPTLTTRNRYLFVASVGCVVRGVPDQHRKFFRYLRETERFLLQGFEPAVVEHLPNSVCAVKASGNAFPPALIAAVTYPLLKAIADSPLRDLSAWPPPHMTSGTVPDSISRVADLCNQRLPKAKAKAKALPKKRPASASRASCKRPASCKAD